MTESIAARWRLIDPKLKYTVLTFVVVRGALALGVSMDPATEALIAGAIATLVGYGVPNDSTVLRRDHESGDAVIPPDDSD